MQELTCHSNDSVVTAALETVGVMAREKKFGGLFCVVSDPVDPLAREAFTASNADENGKFDGLGLLPEQIQGFGLGVMHARGAYYAEKDARYADFLREGRAFGPHGTGLVLANSISRYDDERSRELTQLAIAANMVSPCSPSRMACWAGVNVISIRAPPFLSSE